MICTCLSRLILPIPALITSTIITIPMLVVFTVVYLSISLYRLPSITRRIFGYIYHTKVYGFTLKIIIAVLSVIMLLIVPIAAILAGIIATIVFFFTIVVIIVVVDGFNITKIFEHTKDTIRRTIEIFNDTLSKFEISDDIDLPDKPYNINLFIALICLCVTVPLSIVVCVTGMILIALYSYLQVVVWLWHFIVKGYYNLAKEDVMYVFGLPIIAVALISIPIITLVGYALAVIVAVLYGLYAGLAPSVTTNWNDCLKYVTEYLVMIDNMVSDVSYWSITNKQ